MSPELVEGCGACGGDEFGRDRESDLVYGTGAVEPRAFRTAQSSYAVSSNVRMGLVSTTTSQEALASHSRLPARDRQVIAILLVAAFVVILNETIMSVALPRLMVDLDIRAYGAVADVAHSC